MRKIYKIIIVFFTFVVFVLLQKLVMPKYTEDVIEGGFIKEYYNEKLPHDVLMIGDCELYENFSPIVLWEKYGITSYIRGSAQQLIWQSYYLLEEMLEKEKPKVVIFNVLSLKYNEPQKEEYNRMTIDGMKMSKYKLKMIKSSMLEDEKYIEYLFPILRYHSRIFELTKDDFKYIFKDIKRTIAGYYMRVDVLPYKDDVWEEEKPSSYKFGENAIFYLDKLRTKCAENNIELLLVKAPSLSPKWYKEWDDEVKKYANKYNLKYINFLELVDDIGIDYSKDTYDEGLHMNITGAEKCADYLGKFLKNNYEIKDRRIEEKFKNDWLKKIEYYEQMKKYQYNSLKKYGEYRVFK